MLKELLGPADLKMTLRYAHLSPDHLRAEVEKTEKSSGNIATAVDGIPPRASVSAPRAESGSARAVPYRGTA